MSRSYHRLACLVNTGQRAVATVTHVPVTLRSKRKYIIHASALMIDCFAVSVLTRGLKRRSGTEAKQALACSASTAGLSCDAAVCYQSDSPYHRRLMRQRTCRQVLGTSTTPACACACAWSILASIHPYGPCMHVLQLWVGCFET
jgi:hypothetical protein